MTRKHKHPGTRKDYRVPEPLNVHPDNTSPSSSFLPSYPCSWNILFDLLLEFQLRGLFPTSPFSPQIPRKSRYVGKYASMHKLIIFFSVFARQGIDAAGTLRRRRHHPPAFSFKGERFFAVLFPESSPIEKKYIWGGGRSC